MYKTICSVLLLLSITCSPTFAWTKDRISCVGKALNLNPTPYLLPSDHPLQKKLKTLFPSAQVIQNQKAFEKAGFVILHSQKSSFIQVAYHPSLPKWIFKFYFLSETRRRSAETMSEQDWLVQRCMGAEVVRNVIAKNHFRHFSVPNKWLYELPQSSQDGSKRVFVLVENNMNVLSPKVSREAWKTVITPEYLNELYTIVKAGCGSLYLHHNIPYTKSGTFSFIDTEYPHRTLSLEHVANYLSPEMAAYWNRLISK